MTSPKKKLPEEEHKVGYGKPPVHTRFSKGQSGNPGGRPRGMTAGRATALAQGELPSLLCFTSRPLLCTIHHLINFARCARRTSQSCPRCLTKDIRMRRTCRFAYCLWRFFRKTGQVRRLLRLSHNDRSLPVDRPRQRADEGLRRNNRSRQPMGA
jgi:hypothetical protein